MWRPIDSMFDNLKEGTQLMSIYIPYFYIIQDVRNGMYYAGSKYGQDANPETFMIEGGYTTSSETINELISQHGLNNFIIRKIRTFETAEEAYRYEKRFLEKINARKHPRFYNGHNNDGAMDIEKMKIIMIELYGVSVPLQNGKIKQKYKETNLRKRGVEYPMQCDCVKKKHKQNFLDKHGVENPSQLSETKQKVKITMFENYGGYTLEKDSISRAKFEETMLERYGVDNALKSPEIREKIKNTNVEKYGVENPSQSEEIKAKKKETMMKKYGGIHPNKGRIVITDGKESKFCRPGEIPEGWWKGRPK